METISSFTSIKNVLLLDSEGKRIAVKYYDEEMCVFFFIIIIKMIEYFSLFVGAQQLSNLPLNDHSIRRQSGQMHELIQK